MALVICDARFRQIDKPSPFDPDVTGRLRKDLLAAGGEYLIKNYHHSLAAFGGGKYKNGVRKEVWIKYQAAAGGKFLEKTFAESTSGHKSINVILPNPIPVVKEDAGQLPEAEVAE
jgi:hypothetical protein